MDAAPVLQRTVPRPGSRTAATTQPRLGPLRIPSPPLSPMPTKALFLRVLPALATLPVTSAQGLLPSLVTDRSAGKVWRCTDLDQNGDYHAAGEITPYYDHTLGAVPLDYIVSVVHSRDGVAFVTDSDEDIILRLEDLDEDGDALDVGEATVFFHCDGSNASGLVLGAGLAQFLDDDGTLWVAACNTLDNGGNDTIAWLRDTNGDGDADDVGEQGAYYTPALGGALGDSIPTGVVRGPDGAIYYTEYSTTGALARGIHRLEDLDGSGSIDQPGEVTVFFVAPSLANWPYHHELSLDAQGRFYLSDTKNDVVWRCSDGDGDGVVDPSTEADLIYQAPSYSKIWKVVPAPDGSLYVVEDGPPNRLYRMVDLDGDGLYMGVGEVQTVYAYQVSAVTIDGPRGMALVIADPSIGAPECSPAVPNSTGVPGVIGAFGSESVAANDVILRASSVPPHQFGLFVVSRDAGSQAVPNSQGVLCLSGSIGRFSAILDAGAAGELELAVDLAAIPQGAGAVAAVAGDTWRFQAWTRDVDPTPTSNFTNAVAVSFVP